MFPRAPEPSAPATSGLCACELLWAGAKFPSIHRLSGFIGADLLRRDLDGEVAFITITRFESLEAVRAFAGADYERAVIEPEARALLSRCDERSAHYEVVLDRA